MSKNAFFVFHFIGADQDISILDGELPVAINNALTRGSNSIDQVANRNQKKSWCH